MSKKGFRAAASSGRAATSATSSFGTGFDITKFGSSTSPLSYLAEQPDLSAIQDPTLVVTLKNLSKRDATTKAKALEDLQSFLATQTSSKDQLEDTLLDAWVKVYPRASIEVSRRVRLLAHVVHGMMFSIAGKRAARHMPDVVGAWVTGGYDGDKAVSRSAQEALSLVFSTDEKRKGVLRMYQPKIVSFVSSVILDESAQSLSDERTTSTDDAQAKFHRVIASCLSVIAGLLSVVEAKEIESQRAEYEHVFRSEKLWQHTSSTDSLVRRSLFRLLIVLLKKSRYFADFDFSIAAKALFSKDAVKRQSGSSVEYTESLASLCAQHPVLWTSKAIAKLEPMSRIQSMMRNGSQGGTAQFWVNMSHVFAQMPTDILPATLELAESLLESIRLGICRRDEPRNHSVEGWQCFLTVLRLLLNKFPQEDAVYFRKALGAPLLKQYLNPTTEEQQWTITAHEPHMILSEILACEAMVDTIAEEWSSAAAMFCDEIKTSAPEQSKTYDSSQAKLRFKGQQWFLLQSQLGTKESPSSSVEAINKATSTLLQECIDQVVRREGKPYGAAEILEAALRLDKNRIGSIDESKCAVQVLVMEQLPLLMQSPSRKQLIAILYHMSDQEWFQEAWGSTLSAIIALEDQVTRKEALQDLFGSPYVPRGFDLPRSSIAIQELILNESENAVKSRGNWKFMHALLQATPSITTPQTDDSMLSTLMESVTIVDLQEQSLLGIETLLDNRPDLMRGHMATEQGQALLTALLSISESSDKRVSASASKLKDRIESHTLSGSTGSALSSVKQIIMRELANANPKSLSVDSLLDLAFRTLDAQEPRAASNAMQLLPDLQEWQRLTQVYLSHRPATRLCISSELGYLIALLDEPRPEKANADVAAYDASGFSAPLRFGLFTLGLLQTHDLFVLLDDQSRALLFQVLMLSSQILSDALSLPFEGAIWYTQDVPSDSRALDFTSEATKMLQKWISELAVSNKVVGGDAEKNFVDVTRDHLFSSLDVSPHGFHIARAYARSTEMLIDAHGLSSSRSQEIEGDFRDTYRTKSVIHTAAFVAGWKGSLTNSAVFSRFCNELIADLTGSDALSEPSQCLQKLALLNTSLPDQEHIIEAIAKPRLIRFIQHMIVWVGDLQYAEDVRTQAWRALSLTVSFVDDLYGEHWSDMLSSLQQLWTVDLSFDNESDTGSTFVLLHSSLKLLSAIESIVYLDDTNEDLKEAWEDAMIGLVNGAVRLLEQVGNLATERNQHLDIINDLLARSTLRLPVEKLADISPLFALMSSNSEAVQRAAFTILHARIPAMQDDVSFETAINKTTAKLPEELLSLILEAPSEEDYDSTDFQQSIPPLLRTYLSSWLLVFDHFKGASEKVKSDYAASIKEGDFATGLFEFMVSFLGHKRGKPIDASRFEVTTFSFDIVDSPMRETQWLLIFLWYLSLKHIAPTSKAWWIECKSRLVSQSIEQWTEKHFSTFVTADVLQTVSDWEKTQDASSDDALQIKINEKAKEVVASREVDDQTMAIVVRLPSNYPLGPAAVDGLNRVAVDEKKWQSWLLICKGVILFANGSIIDGLISFRRNVSGALTGQVECAICYSIVSSDKQLPTKKCSTCANLFHGTCLYRWFKSSNSSSCPLCRNPFNYG